MHPVVRDIIAPGGKPAATELFSAEYRLSELKRKCLATLSSFDCLLTPTAGRLFTVSEMLDNPIVHNSELGYYTNFVNLLDLCAVSVPTALTAAGLPFGITVFADHFCDRALLSIANRIQQQCVLPMGILDLPQPALSQTPVGSSITVDIVVCGAHLQGQPLNWQLQERGAVLRSETRTSPAYRLYRLPGDQPMRPALVRDALSGLGIKVEVWSMPLAEFGSFVAGIPSPLGIGKVELEDHSVLSGFVCEQYYRTLMVLSWVTFAQ